MKWDVILGITSSVGLFHAFFLIGSLLFIKKGNRVANILLALILVAFAIRIFKSTYYSVSGSMLWYLPILGLTGMSFNGPLLLFYTKHLQRDSFSWKQMASHFVLPLLTVLNFFIVDEVLLRTTYLVVILVQVGYIAYTASLIFRSADFVGKHWVVDLTIAFAFIEAIYFLQWTQLNDLAYVIATCVSSLVLLSLTYLGLLKYDVFRKIHHYRLDAETDDNAELRTQIRKRIVEEEGFRDSTLTLKVLAEYCNVSPARVSAAIQHEFNKTFPELVNEMRLRYVTGRLQTDYGNEKVETLAFDAGFQSPSSFYAHFKKTFNMTPSEYRTEYRNRSDSV